MLYVPGVDGKVHRLNPMNGVENTTGGFPVTVLLATQTEKIGSPLNVAGGYVYAETSGRGTSPIVRAGVVYVSATNQLVALDETTGAILGSNNALGSVHCQSPVVARGVATARIRTEI